MNVAELDIPVLDLRPEIDSLWDDLQAAINGVLRSGQFIMGPNEKALEQEVAEYLGVKHAVGLNSGTDALFIALRALGIGPDDEVITTAFSFFATAEAISHVGATPVFVDIDPATFNIDPNRIGEAITTRTKAIIPVHLFGQPCDMDPILGIARDRGLRVIEDTAQAFGATYKGRKAGTMGAIGCFSFFPTKNLGAYGDGGMLTTDDDRIAALARMMRFHGSKQKYHNEMVGYNSRLDELQAAILRVKLPHVDEWNEQRRRAAQQYDQAFRDVPGITMPPVNPNVTHAYHQYTIRVMGGRRDEIRDQLSRSGVQTMVYYPVPVDRLPVYDCGSAGQPNAASAASQVLSLPLWPAIPRNAIDTTIRALTDALR